MSPADELRAAAARLEELAASATPGPWTADHELITAPSGTGSGAPTLITEVVGSSFEGGGVAREPDSAWIAAMSPALAAPLAELLQAAAEMQDIADGAYAATRDRSLALLGPEPSRPAPAPNVARAVAVARVINGTTS